jgi:hypothetical protein
MKRTGHSLLINGGASAEARAAWPRLALLLSLPAAALALGACTVIRVNEQSSVRTRYYPGIAVVRIAPGGATQLVEVRAVGPAIVGNQASLGWLDSRIVLVPTGRCHLILWRPSRAAANELRALFGSRTELCTLAGESE